MITRVIRISTTPAERSVTYLAFLFFLDAVFTIIALETGLAIEANPIMAFYYSLNPIVFVIAKFALLGGGLYLLIPHMTIPNVRWILRALVFVYGLIFVYHLAGLSLAWLS